MKNSFQNLEVWKEARELNSSIFKELIDNSDIRDLAIKDQINRSAGSVMDNIAEGHGRGGNKELIQYLYIARGSCYEVLSQLIRASDRDYINQDQFKRLVESTNSIGKQLNAYLKYLKASEFKGGKFKNQ